jgi:hypothetical protein
MGTKCFALSIGCADKNYPKEFPTKINYEVNKSANEIAYSVSVKKEFDGKEINSVEAFVGDIQISIPIEVNKSGNNDWFAYVDAKPGHETIILKANYGFPCTAIISTELRP